MNDWIECIVGDVAAPTRNALVGGPFGSNLVSKDYVDYGVPVIRGQNMGFGKWVTGDFVFVSPEKARELAANIARPGDLVFTQRGTLGQVAIVPDAAYERYIVSQSQMKLTVDSEKADAHFLYYYFSTSEQQEHIRQNSIQTGVPHTNLTILRNTPLYLPPLIEQRAIAHILGSLDDKIESNLRMNETLEATARAIFKSWFVDFDPVHYKSRGEQPPGMDAQTAALFPDSFEESDLGLIPSGWRVGTLGDDFNLTMGQSPPGKTYNEEGEGLPFYQGRRDFGSRYPSLRVFCSQPSRIAQPGDTLVSVRAPVGDINLAIEECCIGRGVAAVRHKSGSRSYTFYSMLALGEQFQNYNGEGTVFGSINGKDFANIEMVLPPGEVAQSFEAILYGIDQLIENNELQIRMLTETRDALLPKLVSGELRVGEMVNSEGM